MLLRSVRSRLLGLVVAAFVPFVALIGIGLWNQWQHDRQRAVEGSIHQAQLLAAQVDDRIGELELLLTGLSRSVSPSAADMAANTAVLRGVKAELPAFVGNIVLYSLDGTYIGTTGAPEYNHSPVTDRAYFRQVLEGQRISIGDVVRSRPTGQWTLNLARPVEDQAGRLAAVLVVGILLERFQDALRVQGAPPSTVVTITNEKGIVVARNIDGSGWIGRDVSRWTTFVYNVERSEGSAISRWRHSGNREYITGFSTAHTVPWRVQVGLPKSTALAPVIERLELSALFIIASFISACGIAWLLSGRIARPLRQLARDAAILAAGRLSHRTAVRTSDECGMLGDSFNDMASSLERREGELRRMAHYDPLTGLPNRLSLQHELGGLLAEGVDSPPAALALCDLDGFKEVNDTLGHSTGDKLLVEVGLRLTRLIESRYPSVKVYRLGGDEFVVLMPNCGDPRAIHQAVDAVQECLSQPFQIGDQALHVAASAGVAIAPNDGASADELLSNADLSLYQAKSAGGRACRFFTHAFRAKAQAQRGLGLELRRAFGEDEFELYFQPQVRLADNAVVGAEALLRWRHPVRGVILPGAFIEALAKSAIAFDVGRWIIRSACQNAAAWRRMGLPRARISVNLFPAHAHDPSVLSDVKAALGDFDLPPDALELEITESAAFNFGEPSPPLQRLHELGVKLAFDDFGTGFASLSYLTRFPVSRIKIDRSFVANILHGTNDATIVRSLITMAHSLGLKVIAEGVETQAQAAFLVQEGCEEAQGFLYSEPLPAAEFERYLRAEERPGGLRRSLPASLC